MPRLPESVQARGLQVLRHAHKAGVDLAQHVLVRPPEFAAFGSGSRIEPPCKLIGRRYITIGDGVYLSSRSLLAVQDELYEKTYSPRLSIGSRTTFGSDLFISCCGEITIGEDVQGSARVFIADSYHDYRDITRPPSQQPFADPEPVVIGNGSFLGVGCCVLGGVTLGERAYVAANAVVTRDVPAFSLVAGAPARVVRRYDGTNWVSA